jgi:hypothetical protein
VLGRLARLCRSCWKNCAHAGLLGGLLVLVLLAGPKGCCSWVRLRELAAACVTSSTASAATSSFGIVVSFLQHDEIESQQVLAQHRHLRMIAELIMAPEVEADPSAPLEPSR